MQNTQTPTLQEMRSLKTRLNTLVDEDLKPKQKTIYNSKIDQLRNDLNKVGISKDLTLREAERELEKWIELLSNPQTTTTEVPRPEGLNNTTLTSDQLENFDKDIERIKESEKIRADQKVETARFEKRNKEIYAEQQRIQAEIAKVQAVQEKFKDKVLYAKVIIPESIRLEEQEQKDLEILREYAKADEVTKTKLIDDLATKIEPKLENVPEEQKVLIARTEAVKIVEALAKPEVIINENVSAAILNTIHQDKKAVEVVSKILNKDDELILAAKNGATLIALADRNQKVSTEVLIENLFGSKLSAAIIGPKKIQVVLSEVKIEDQTTYQVNLYDLNKENIKQLHHQESILDSIKEYGQKYGYDKISGVFTNYARTYLEEKVAAMPAGSIIKKAYSSSITQSILAKYGLANPVVWEAAGQSGQFVGFLMKIAPDTAGPLLVFAGKALGKEFVKPVVGLATKEIAGQIAGKVVADAGTKAAVGTGLAATITAAFAWTGPLAPVIGAVGAFLATSVIGEGIANLWSKLKVWWTENKDKAGPAIAVALGFGGLVLGGPAVGGLVLLGGLAATGTLAVAVTGAFGVLGFIGRSVGIAIATPVIVTLLVLPPLVAFIMLVINNSAYVVPPGLSSSALNGGADNPYMLVTKIASPNKIDNPTSPQQIIYGVSIKAIKESLFNVKITAVKCTVLKKDGKKMVCPDEDVPPLEEGKSISPTQVHAFSFISRYDARFNDSLVIDSIEVTAELADGTTITSSGFASLCIGDCPNDCPSIWPTSHGYITQGAHTPASCGKSCSHSTTESIDIGVSHVGVYATHTGTVVKAEKNSCYGNRIWIKSICNGKDFVTQYAHLEGIGIKNGQSITMGQTIGVSGNTGTCTTGPHLHYEFKYYPNGAPNWPDNPPFMMKPFIPVDIKRGCKTAAECGVSF